MKIKSSPTTRKLDMGPCGTFIYKHGTKKSDWKSYHAGNSRVTMLGSEPPTRCRNSNHGGKKDIVLKHLPCSKNRNNHMFSLPGYAGVKLLAHAGWVLPTWKGRVQSSDVFIIAEKQCCEMHYFEVEFTQNDYTSMWPQLLTKAKTEL